MSDPILIEIHVLKETEKMAMLDGLTGIFNRRYFDLTLWAKKEESGVVTYGIQFMDLKTEQLQKMIQLLPSDFYDPTEKKLEE